MFNLVSNPELWIKEVIEFIIPILIGGSVGILFDDDWIYVGGAIGFLFWLIIRILL